MCLCFVCCFSCVCVVYVFCLFLLPPLLSSCAVIGVLFCVVCVFLHVFVMWCVVLCICFVLVFCIVFVYRVLFMFVCVCFVCGVVPDVVCVVVVF